MHAASEFLKMLDQLVQTKPESLLAECRHDKLQPQLARLLKLRKVLVLRCSAGRQKNLANLPKST